jgi:hypothetical protein
MEIEVSSIVDVIEININIWIICVINIMEDSAVLWDFR